MNDLRRYHSDRKNHPEENSYISGLFKKGINKIAQKVGEEAIELVIEARSEDERLFLNEAADLLFHYLILLEAKGHNLKEVTDVLQDRHNKKKLHEKISHCSKFVVTGTAQAQQQKPAGFRIEGHIKGIE